MSLLDKNGSLYYQKQLLLKTKEIPVGQTSISYGKSITQNNRNKGKFPLFGSNGIIEYIDEWNTKKAVIFGCRGTLGNIFFNSDECFVLNTSFYIEDSENYGNIFFSLKKQKGFVDLATGAAQPQLTIENIKNEKLLFIENNRLNTFLELMSKYQKTIKLLKQIKEILLSKYF
ncbi:restriction endonuclease subunit S [Mycoplasma procyoni]|uniref:restriction endonuclease subunit S n=1 Tax=Mycoplasma procyoni TaxID=568784 RepID=UPI00197BD353|nr:restriction endonuclease subunit S [Mycoplasma procyoni]MBN3534507.1 restriction endonuclease subunit S [Mycoplasma procyoni]